MEDNRGTTPIHPRDLRIGASRERRCACATRAGSVRADLVPVKHIVCIQCAPLPRLRGLAGTEPHPLLGPHLDEGVAVAIDSTIYQDALLEPIGPDSEVFILAPDRGRLMLTTAD